MEKLDERGDDWYLEEFQDVFGLIGPPAIESLVTYLANDSQGEFPRGKAADGLREIARRSPETRERVVAILAAELARHQQDVGELNGFLVANLLELKAVEAAETIERAFAANVIDPTMAGDWGTVRQKLGVPGLGIAPDQCPGWPSIRERVGLGFPTQPSERHDPPIDRKRQQDAKRRAKLKRKQTKRDRKRNRKPR